MKKELLEESTKIRWKKLAGIINEITRHKEEELNWEWEQEREAAEEAAKAAAAKQSPDQATLEKKVINDKVMKPALEKVLADVTDEWEKDFLQKFSRMLEIKFSKEKTNLQVAVPEAEYKLDKYKQQYRDWFREQGIPDYATAIQPMNFDMQTQFEKPLLDMMKDLVAEPFDPSMAPQEEPEEEEDLSDRYTQPDIGTDLSPEQLAQQKRKNQALRKAGSNLFGAFGDTDFRGVAEGKNLKVKKKK